MAQVGVSQADVDLDYGNGVKGQLTNGAGRYTYIAYMTEAAYNALPANFSIEAKKSGYVGATASVAKPDFASAVANGIQIDAVISKIDPTQFSITPDKIEFPPEGGTATVTVNAPDNTWDFTYPAAAVDYATVVRTDDQTLTVTCEPNTIINQSFWVDVTWGYAELSLWIRSLK